MCSGEYHRCCGRTPSKMSTTLLILVASASLGPARAAQPKGFSNNPICRQRNCVNPIFPGLLDLQQLEDMTWQCRSNSDVKPFLRFCADVVNYDVAIASPNSSSATLQSIVIAQEQAAATTYFYHLSGLNMEPWVLRDTAIANSDPCVQATRMMVCNTYFPKAQAGCAAGQSTLFQRPCKNVCTDYVQACKVECCDESVKCVYDGVSLLSDGSNATSAYVDAEGPSTECTGQSLISKSAARNTRPSWLLFTFSVLLLSSGSPLFVAGLVRAIPSRRAILSVFLCLVMASLQGCDVVSGAHETKGWESKPRYVTEFMYIPPGRPVSEAALNSCEVNGLPESERCSGNGVCTSWNRTGALGGKSLSFCLCNRGWADPECRTRRKSQFVAFMLSVFGGFLGLDAIYLGNYYHAMGKLSTLGGLGVWWFYDIVRIGSSPVYTGTQFRVAQDLSHTMYVFFVLLFAAVLGVLIFGLWASMLTRKKRMHKLLLQEEDEFIRSGSATVDENAWDLVGAPSIQSFPLPRHVLVGHGVGAYAPTVQNNHALKPHFHGHSTRLMEQSQPVYPSYQSTAMYCEPTTRLGH